MKRCPLPFATVSLGALALFLGCRSTQPVANAPAAPAPPEAATTDTRPAPAPQPPAPPAMEADTAPVPTTTAARTTEQAFAYFYRKKRILGAALNTSVHVDQVEIADLDPGNYVKVPLTPGKHWFYADEEDDTLSVDVEPGKEYFFRIELKAGMWKGHGIMKLVDAKEGAPEFEKWELKQAKDIRKPELVVKDPRKP